MNDYCVKAINYIKKNYKDILMNHDYLSISVGGSIARGYGNKYSDIDLICIGENVEKYKKRFLCMDSYTLEVHEIPVSYLNNIVKQLSTYISFPNLDNKKIENVSLNNKAFGAKKCKKIDKKDNQLTTFLSNWRELKKIVDSIVISDNLNFLASFKREIIKFDLKESFFDLLNLNNNLSNSDKIINLMKLNSFINNDVFSKVLWVDFYLEKDYNSDISEKIFQKSLYATNNKEKFYNWYHKNVNHIYKLHNKNECDICIKDIMQCNIMRCIHDYYNDAIKAQKEKYKLGEFFSIQRVLMYIKLLYDKSDCKDVTLNKLIKEFEFTNDEYYIIDNIVRRNIYDKNKNKKKF